MKSFQPKKKDDEDNQFTYYRGFVRLTNEVNDLAGQHERLAEELQLAIVAKVQGQMKELREDRKRVSRIYIRSIHTVGTYHCVGFCFKYITFVL